MKAQANIFLGVAVFGASLAYAQQNLPQVQHVIVVIQENRTPDNLFGSDLQGGTPQLPGADLVKTGKCKTSSGESYPSLAPLYLDTCLSPDHGHAIAPKDNAWVVTYNGGAMDGACNAYFVQPSGCLLPSNNYPQLTYVDNSSGIIQPYFTIASRWGFANYMFQTNQGPSFPAHQFLFTGTSAPDTVNDPAQNCGGLYPCWQWFVAENEKAYNSTWGCPGTTDTIYEIDPSGNESLGYAPPGGAAGYPCYTHNTMATLLDANQITWAYYPQGPNPRTSLWTAPNAIAGICQPLSGGQCNGAEWNSNVSPHIPPAPPQTGKMAPILSDIQNCNLKNVSWVIPDGVWSDHPGCPNGGCTSNNGQESGHIMGPSWVADIVNAVGNSTACDGGTGYWKNTAILVTWDDWGGFFDHISPSQAGAPGIGYSNLTGKQYVYGFRVPLLVVSAYAKPGYISGVCGQSGQPACPNLQAPFVHDFGSILNFIEWAFGTNNQFLHLAGQPSGTGINPGYPYADVLAPDQPTAPNCTAQLCPYGLSDFFNFNQSPAVFGSSIAATYGPTWFENFGTKSGAASTKNGYPASANPDDDGDDENNQN